MADDYIYFGKGVPREHWARFKFISEHGDTIREQVREARRAQGLPERVELAL